MLAAACLYSAGSGVAGAAIPVYGSPGYTPGVGGYIAGVGSFDGINNSMDVNNAGVAIGRANRYDAAGVDRDLRSLRWSATAADVLGDLGTSGGLAFTAAHAINNAGVAAGAATIGFGDDRAVRWNGPGVAAVQLPTPLGLTSARIQDINDAGVSLGMASNMMGTRAVRWDAAGAPTVLPGLAGNFSYEAYAINNAAISIGRAFDGVTDRAVRWDAAGAITELGHLGLDAAGVTVVSPYTLNSAGTAVGYSFKHDAAGNYQGTVPVRWDGAGTAATELDTLAPNFNGWRFGLARDINDAGVTVGNVSKAPSFPTDEFGQRAARWDATGTAVTVLATLGTAPNGEGTSDAWAINASGLIVGAASRFNAITSMADQRAVYWKPGASTPLDLNSLIDPASGWFLADAYAVSDTGWIAGDGMFDPDGPGGQEAYGRLFLMQVPEPAAGSALMMLAAGAAAFTRRRGARRRDAWSTRGV
jgi:hypothetical protein